MLATILIDILSLIVVLSAIVIPFIVAIKLLLKPKKKKSKE